jgi:hypothetical protein
MRQYLPEKLLKQKGLGVKCLPRKSKSLSLNPRTKKKKKEKEKGEMVAKSFRQKENVTR